MKRQARVPASTAVKMNNASNKIAKWYQNAIIERLLKISEMICAIPIAKVGAPPVRERIELSPTS